MSKAGGVTLSAYWPPGIPRHVAVPQRPLQTLVARQARTSPDGLALRSGGTSLTYGDLDRRMQRVAARAGSAPTQPSRVALVEADPAEAVALLLCALQAGIQVAVLDSGVSADSLLTYLRLLRTEVILTSTGPRDAGSAPVQVIGEDDLAATPVEEGRSTRSIAPREPAVLLPAGPSFVAHSHFTLAAMARSLASFAPTLRDLDLVWAGAPFEWETLTATLASLLSGRTAAFGPPGTIPGRPEEAYTILSRAEAEGIVEAGRAAEGLGRLRYVFLSTGPFAPRWRRRLEAIIGRAVLPLWGSVETGPAVAAHPTWYPVDAHGIPLVNVSLIPIDPDTGRVSEVPWEMLARAELGVDSPSVMVETLTVGGPDGPPDDRIFRTGAIVEMDQIGIIRFIA